MAKNELLLEYKTHKLATPDDLMNFWAKYHRPSRKSAEELVGDARKNYTNIAATMGNLACNLSCWYKCKQAKDANGTSVYAYSVKLCYENIPIDIRTYVRLPRELGLV